MQNCIGLKKWLHMVIWIHRNKWRKPEVIRIHINKTYKNIIVVLLASLKDIKLCKVIILTMYFGVCNVYKCNLYTTIPQKGKKSNRAL